MGYIEQLRLSKDKATVAFQEFALSTRELPDHLYCFFEGKDNAYYVPRIKNYTSKIKPVNCGGREKVLKVYELITSHEEYGKYKKAFFIDKDFNSPLTAHIPPIFETPCYSVENLYVSIDSFKEILVNEFQLSEVSDDAFQISVTLYTNRQNEFHEAVTLFNSWYSCLIDIRNATSQKTGVQLENKLPKGFVNFSFEQIEKDYDVEKIYQTFPNAPIVDSETITNKIAIHENGDKRLLFRGKYEMQFLLKFIELLLKDSASTKVHLNEKINFSFGDGSSTGHEQALNIFSAYAETPESLVHYIKNVC